MAKKVGDTYVNLGLKKGDFDAGLKRAKTGMREFERDTLDIKKTLKGLAPAIAGAFSVAAVAGFGKAVLDAAAEQDRATKTLAAAMQQAGTYTEAALQHNLDYASSLQRISTYGDEAITGVQKMLIYFGVEGRMLDDLTKATLDLAAAKGMDLKGAADLVAKSVGSSTNALSRYGIQVEGDVGSTERLQMAVDNITELFGGAAQAEAATYTGQVIQLTNAWGDLQEQLGDMLIGPASQIIEWMKDGTEWLQALITKYQEWSSVNSIAIRGLRDELAVLERDIATFDPTIPGDLAIIDRLQAEIDKRRELIALYQQGGSGAAPAAEPAAGRGAGTAAGAAPEADPYWDKIFAQHAGRRQRDSDLDYQLWLSERERMAAESARQIARDDEMFAQHAARKREDVLLDENTAYQSWLEERGRQTETMSEAMKNAITGWGAHFSSTLNDAVWDADVSFASIAESFGRMITQMMIQKAVVEPIMAKIFPSARGNVFAHGEIVPFARGGVIDQPTIFPMAKGLGLMGEAGPEAVMPLARTSSGDLGVRAEGLAGAEPRVEVNVYAPAGSAARVEERQTAGGKVIDVIIDEMMAGQVRPGSRFDRAMRGRYGLAPATTRR